jgi:hypothetical protein
VILTVPRELVSAPPKNDTFSFFRCEFHHSYNTYNNGYYSILFFLIIQTVNFKFRTMVLCWTRNSIYIFVSFPYFQPDYHLNHNGYDIDYILLPKYLYKGLYFDNDNVSITFNVFKPSISSFVPWFYVGPETLFIYL